MLRSSTLFYLVQITYCVYTVYREALPGCPATYDLPHAECFLTILGMRGFGSQRGIHTHNVRHLLRPSPNEHILVSAIRRSSRAVRSHRTLFNLALWLSCSSRARLLAFVVVIQTCVCSGTTFAGCEISALSFPCPTYSEDSPWATTPICVLSVRNMPDYTDGRQPLPLSSEVTLICALANADLDNCTVHSKYCLSGIRSNSRGEGSDRLAACLWKLTPCHVPSCRASIPHARAT